MNEQVKQTATTDPLVIARLLEQSAAYIARGLVEGAYAETAGGNKCAERLMDAVSKSSQDLRVMVRRDSL